MSSIIIDNGVEPISSIVIEEEVKEEYIEINTQPVFLMKDFVRADMGDGIVKDLSYEDFIGILSAAANSTISKEDNSFKLPNGCFYISTGNNKVNIMCYYPEAIKPFKYQDGIRINSFDIVTPNMIVSHSLKKDTTGEMLLLDTRYLATDLQINELPPGFLTAPNRQKHLFLIPFTNAYNDCKMCFGNNRMPMRFPIDNLRGLDYYYSFLWDTPFNNDLGIRDKVSDFQIGAWYDNLKDIATKGGKFPYKNLR